jgi:predicted dehydrogenase
MPLSRARPLAPRQRSPADGPLKIGILGAARIADDGIVDPSRAAQRGIDKVHQTYAEVIDDPEVEVVYNALANSLHAEWNLYA